MAWKVPAWMFSYDGDRTLLLNGQRETATWHKETERLKHTDRERQRDRNTHFHKKKKDWGTQPHHKHIHTQTEKQRETHTHKLKQTHTIYMLLYLAPPCSIHSFFRFWRRVRGRRERFLFTLGATCTHIDSWTKRVMIHDITTFFASFRDRCCSGLLHGWGRSTELRMGLHVFSLWG